MEYMVDLQTAEEDSKRFFKALNLSELKLSKLEEEKDTLIELIQLGNVEISEDGALTYNLQYPLKGESGQVFLTKLEFAKRRITVGEMEKHLQGKNEVEKARRILGYLTKQNSQIFTKMDDDFVSLGTISAFFLPR